MVLLALLSFQLWPFSVKEFLATFLKEPLFEGKFLNFRVKPAHLVGHLPVSQSFRSNLNLSFREILFRFLHQLSGGDLSRGSAPGPKAVQRLL